MEQLNRRPTCEERGCLYLSDSHYFLLKSRVREGTNNFVELLALKMLLILAAEKGCKSFQVFGDSMIVINWAYEDQRCHITKLVSIFEEVIDLNSQFDSLSLHHVYRERNNWLTDVPKRKRSRNMGDG